MLAVAERPGKDPFVARCLSGPTAEELLAPCERDIQVGDSLSLTYRFPREFLGDWQALDAAIAAETSACAEDSALSRLSLHCSKCKRLAGPHRCRTGQPRIQAQARSMSRIAIEKL